MTPADPRHRSVAGYRAGCRRPCCRDFSSPAVLEDGYWAPRRHGIRVWIPAPPPSAEELATLKSERRKARQRDGKPRPESVLGVDAVLCAAALHFGLRPAELDDRIRQADYRDARAVAMWILRKDNRSYPEVGRLVGRDHTTVIYNVRRVQRDNDLLATAHRIRVRLIGEAAA